MNPHWYRDFFQGVAVKLWHAAIPRDQTLAEIDFAWQELGLMPDCRVLDVPCGHGRHALELAQRGCDVTGIDLSAEALALARRAADEAGCKVDYVQRDMRHIWPTEPYDAAITLGNSFGYLGPEGTAEFVRAVAAALRPGGRWLINSGAVAESIIPNLRPQFEHPVGEIGFRITNEYLAAESCLHSTFDFTTDGQTETREIWHWIFTVGEIRRMLAAEGLKTLALYSSQGREPYVLGSPQLYLVCEK